ncbi:MAG: 2-dehydro-3-deoxygalactonokinase [Woeseiaceae bacterium]
MGMLDTKGQANHRMKIKFPFVAVDWGTTRMRAMLCSREQTDVDKATLIVGEGISGLSRSVPGTLFDAIEPWVRKNGQLDIVLAGMVGSNLGWRMTPYLPCPLAPGVLRDNLERFEERGHHVAIVPGVSCINPLGQPDVMRGEEMQVLGWMTRNRSTRDSDRLLCLPGTHTKWVRISDGRLDTFTTSLTGEAYSILREHSVLVPSDEKNAPPPFDADSFAKGVVVARQHGTSLLHVLFSTRARALFDANDIGDASSYLSGLLIGSDVQSALRDNERSGSVVELIGDAALCEKFRVAIELMGYGSRISDGVEMVYAGFHDLAAGGNK